MAEILLSEKAKHYLISGRASGETLTVTVSPSEINVIFRNITPHGAVETNVMAQISTVDKQNYTILLKSVLPPMDDSIIEDEQAVAVEFLSFLNDALGLVERRRERDGEYTSQPLMNLRNSLSELLDHLQ